VVFDVICSILQIALPFGEVDSHQVLHEAFAVGGERSRESDFALHDLGLDFHRFVGVEGVDAVDHFEDQDAQCPPVDGLAVALVHYHLGGDVLRRAAESVGFGRAYFCKAEVSHFELSV